MRINLNDWLGHHTWAWWLMVALVCAGTELVRRTPTARILALGALAAAATAAVLPRTPGLQPAVGLFIVVGLILFGRTGLGASTGQGTKLTPNDTARKEMREGKADA